MKFWDYCKDRAGVLLANAAGLLVLSVYLLLLNTAGAAVFLIDVVWVSVLAVWLPVRWYFRRRYFQEIFDTLEELDQRYLIAEVMRPSYGLEDRLYWEILRKSNKSVIEKIREIENSQREYKEYIESWIHEVKTPITAAHLVCGNHKDESARKIMAELDEIENEVEKVLYYARMERVDRDYLIRPVSLRGVVLSAVRGEKRHLIRCGMQVELDIDEEMSVSTDEKWVEFILKQIFSNSMKYRRETGAKIRIRAEEGPMQKSLVIEDNGWGIPEDEIGRIFDKGFTGSNGRTEGSHATGMGLYLCSRLCRKLGLGISCESEKGKYTRMILTFPDSDHNKISGHDKIPERNKSPEHRI